MSIEKNLMMLKHTDNYLAFVSGLFGGIIRFILGDAANLTYGQTLVQAFITAMICGAAGWLGKELVVWIKSCFRRKFGDNEDEE